MSRSDEDGAVLPPRIKAAFNFLHHTRMITEQCDVSIPTRQLTAMEKSVEAAALRALQQYLLGEMDFVESSDHVGKRRDDGEDDETAPVNSTR